MTQGWCDMRRIFVLLWPLLMLPITASSQISCERQIDGPGKKVSGSSAPIFELQKPFEHPVALPSHVLTLLHADEQNADKFKACRSRENLAQIPAFRVLHTHTGGYPDLCTSWGQFAQFYQTIYICQGGKYVPFSDNFVTMDFFPPRPK